jgi:hypothetical protein
VGSDQDVEVTALAINAAIPESARWTDTRRGEVFQLMTLNVRLLRSAALWAGHRGNR